jgi:hypothetical protein
LIFCSQEQLQGDASEDDVDNVKDAGDDDADFDDEPCEDNDDIDDVDKSIDEGDDDGNDDVAVPSPSTATPVPTSPYAVEPVRPSQAYRPRPTSAVVSDDDDAGVGRGKGSAEVSVEVGKGSGGLMKGGAHGRGLLVATQKPAWAYGKKGGKIGQWDEWGGQYVKGGYMYQGTFFPYATQSYLIPHGC